MTTVYVSGTPAPQGSKILRKNKAGRVWMADDNAHRLRAWREAVTGAWVAADAPRVDGPAFLGVTFYVPRPRGHYGTGRNAERVRPSAPRHPAVLPDLDKYLRATMDALTRADAWEDDARVVTIAAAKRYADAECPVGARVTVAPVPGQEARP